ncbi:MAG: UDP-N-acetylmuramyl-tripeptide synthetase [Oscillospiraceae bacterium]|nr:UDP-N-acetylmuramyl-tripeptide synthetase [Oscillospiraceae bacterium]
MIYFNSDYLEGAHPLIIEKLTQTNMEQTIGYGCDEYCEAAREKIKAACQAPEADVHFLVGGTQTNTTVIASILRPYQGVLTAVSGHINCHETGAIESTGHKVIALPSDDGKITAKQVEDYYLWQQNDESVEHIVQPGMVYISHPTEGGTLYTKAELTEMYETCRKHGLPLFIDGARLGYGLTADSSDLTLPEVAQLCDVFYIGGTKIGALFGEAIVIMNPALKKDFRYMMKQRGGMMAKGRLLGLQFDVLFTDDLYLKIARHANEMAYQIRDIFVSAGYPMLFESDTNQQYPIMSDDELEEIGKEFGYEYWTRVDETHSGVRFCASWATTQENVDELRKAVAKLKNMDLSNRYGTKEAERLLKKEGLLVESSGENVYFTGLSNNSKETKEGDLFICKGFGFKPEYLQLAINRGAVCYVAENEIPTVSIPFIKVNDARKAQSILARWFNGNPSDSFKLVGITGTKGKTTTTYMVRGVMNAIAGRSTGLVSGMERDVGGEVIASHLTTPESLEMQQLFAEARDNGMPIVTAEISSQAYKLDRVYGQHFDYGIFLNIGPDHISPHEHPTMEDYLMSKVALLENSDVAVICRDTDYFDTVYGAAKAKCKKVCLIGKEDDCDYRFHDISKLPSGYSFLVTERETGETYPYSVAMDGLFNIKNAVCAIAVGRMMGGAPAVIADALKDLVVSGRSDVYVGEDLTVFVNYMHNGISCQAVLEGLQQDYPGAYITVLIGVAGQRSPQRVQGVGEACGKYADRIFFTADDPDLEDPRDIGMRLVKAAGNTKAKITVEPDRAKAVEQAILEAPAGSLVVLGGKGSEDTQRVNGEYVYYESDTAIAQRVLPLRAKLKEQK